MGPAQPEDVALTHAPNAGSLGEMQREGWAGVALAHARASCSPLTYERAPSRTFTHKLGKSNYD